MKGMIVTQFVDSSRLASSDSLFFCEIMKFIHHSLFSLITLGFAAWFVGCSDDPGIEIPEAEAGDENETIAQETNIRMPRSPGFEWNGVIIIPEAKIKAPGPRWVGSRSEFDLIFVEHDSTDGKCLDYLKLFIRSDATPYTGSINRVYLSGAPKFTGNYENGFLEGVVRRWNSDGSLASSSRAKSGMTVEVEIQGEFGSNGFVLPVHAEPSQEDVVIPSELIFVGDNDNLVKWAMLTFEEGIDYLLDKRTGKKVTGGLQVHDNNGGIFEFNYDDGLKHGPETQWNEKGIKIYETNFVKGKRYGIETTWNDDGTISSQNIYDNGELVESLQN